MAVVQESQRRVLLSVSCVNPVLHPLLPSDFKRRQTKDAFYPFIPNLPQRHAITNAKADIWLYLHKFVVVFFYSVEITLEPEENEPLELWEYGIMEMYCVETTKKEAESQDERVKIILNR